MKKKTYYFSKNLNVSIHFHLINYPVGYVFYENRINLTQLFIIKKFLKKVNLSDK